ncbi:MAG: MotA/TolQ/ExbB proton channel family protein [Hyphomonadaceae bacterium]|nr:MotA/TolQ/ExbB proton channel family protein [Hyphomonadaceae bacterium]
MKRNSGFFRRFIVLAIALVAAVILIGILRVTTPPPVQEILLDADASFWPFTIQNFMWVALMVGFGEIALRWNSASEEEGQLRRGYLPDDDALLTSEMLSRIREGVALRKFGKDCFLPRMIIRTIDQYQLNKKEDQAASVMNASLELYMHEIDLRYSMLRYISWLIPSLGFIGTVMGIMFALQYAGVPANAESEDFLYQVTSRLGVAFTTTLLALIMSSVLVLLQSVVQAKEERALNAAGQYCLDHLILQLGDSRTR